MRSSFRFGLLVSLLLGIAAVGRAQPLPVKVAVVVTFELGNDEGDVPGEFQFWAERETWARKLTVPGVDHPVYVSADGVIGVVSGTTTQASNQIMALVLSGQFDFSKTYWVVNGIAGVDPHAGTLGSAAWARYVVDGDIGFELDARDAPAAWPYGIFALGTKAPNQVPKHEGWEPNLMTYALNPALVDWAYRLTKDTPIPDSEKMKSVRARYAGFPLAQAPPRIFLGDDLGSSRYWGGKVMTQWAADWVKLHTGGRGVFAMTEMEDQGVAAALHRLAAMGKVDFQRLLVLRSASDFSMPPGNEDASESFHGEFSGFRSALEANYAAGSRVVHALVKDWATYESKPPTGDTTGTR